MAHAEVSSEMAWGPGVVMKPGGEEDFESSRACKAMVEGAPVPTAMGGSQQGVSSLGDSDGRAEFPLLSTQASVPMFQGCLNPECKRGEMQKGMWATPPLQQAFIYILGLLY